MRRQIAFLMGCVELSIFGSLDAQTRFEWLVYLTASIEQVCTSTPHAACDAYPLPKVEKQTSSLERKTSSPLVKRRPATRAYAAAAATAALVAAAGSASIQPHAHDGTVNDDADSEPAGSCKSSDSSACTPSGHRTDSGKFSAFYPSTGGSTGQLVPHIGVVFLHGVGVGIFPYLAFIWKLLNVFERDMPIIIPQVSSQQLSCHSI
ncbi:MAG: hypothetical protein HC767_13390 [Akkermansiaceae bacterium]|nr:hypothetical protein [Akkermansiaceae bacterium]